MDTIERFWSKVDKTRNCWEWTGPPSKSGYGRFCFDKTKVMYAHRYSYLITYGDIGTSYVLHGCDNRRCVRPDHLFLGTCADNAIDAASKGRLKKKLTEHSIKNIRERHAQNEASQRDLAREFGVTHRAIGLILKRRTWKHVL